ncbi:MAG TPA: hypothetical protein VGC13_08975 [Longimicrobium sp.]|jgi:hypothetical protein|uniref:hypothetical protein n=1 Tax=Longimicrobium sp. TaxID=2029185 RepID=UPI002ED7C23D
MQRSKTVRQGLFGAAVTLALGFGAMEAVAAPGATAGATAVCTYTFARQCNQNCQSWGYDYGLCDPETGMCICE